MKVLETDRFKQEADLLFESDSEDLRTAIT